jgi:hypothetical protein
MKTNCCFQGFDDIRSSVSIAEPEFTCIHGRTLRWSAARRALDLDPCPYEMPTCGRKPTAEETPALTAAGNW